MEIRYIHEPTDLQCGQAVLAMLTGLSVQQVTGELRNEHETNLREMKAFLRGHGFRIADDRVPVREKGELPPCAVPAQPGDAAMLALVPVLRRAVLRPRARHPG